MSVDLSTLSSAALLHAMVRGTREEYAAAVEEYERRALAEPRPAPVRTIDPQRIQWVREAYGMADADTLTSNAGSLP